MVADDDSYVYLSAINCLCEMGLYNKNMFEDTIEYYEEMSNQPQKDTKMIIRVGRVAEAIGKLLLARGEISVTYFDRLATLFMKGIDEPEEILRASSCGAFGNLMIATRGRGSEKWLGQVFHKIVNIIRVDRSPLVRRSAADLIRHSLQSTGRDMLAVSGFFSLKQKSKRLSEFHTRRNFNLKKTNQKTLKMTRIIYTIIFFINFPKGSKFFNFWKFFKTFQCDVWGHF